MLLYLLACATPSDTPPDPPPPASVRADDLFARGIVSPVPGVHVAVGYALANMVFLEGPDGIVVVDSTESVVAAREVLADLRRVTEAPVRALILTHNHADHVFGGGAVVEEAERNGTAPIEVWAHATTEGHIDRVVSVVRDAIEVRSLRMFGTALPEQPEGIGPGLRYRPEDVALVRPTRTFEGRVTVSLAGLELELAHAPGETDDQIRVWWPERKVLLPADNVYQAFPNLYTLRGTTWRDPEAWVGSLDAMRDLEAEVMVPQHTRPVVGAAAVADVLTAWRDAISYVHHQTLRGINQGRTPDELAASIALPPHLSTHPWLQPVYGRVDWSVRAIHAGTLGWYDGEAAHLDPLPPEARAQRYAAAFAAGRPLPEAAREALAAGELAWAAELSLLWRRAHPEDADAPATLAGAYEGLGRAATNPNARSWYLTQAAELRGEVRLQPSSPARSPVELVDGLPLDAFLRGLGPRLRAEEVLDVDWRGVITFTDARRTFVLHVRRGVLEVRERTADEAARVAADLRLTTTGTTWKRLATGHEGAVEALASGRLRVGEGGLGELVRFQGWLERPGG